MQVTFSRAGSSSAAMLVFGLILAGAGRAAAQSSPAETPAGTQSVPPAEPLAPVPAHDVERIRQSLLVDTPLDLARDRLTFYVTTEKRFPTFADYLKGTSGLKEGPARGGVDNRRAGGGLDLLALFQGMTKRLREARIARETRDVNARIDAELRALEETRAAAAAAGATPP